MTHATPDLRRARPLCRSVLLLALIAGLAAAPAAAQTVFEAHLLGANEVSPVNTAATGHVTAVLAGDQLHVTGAFGGLSSDYTASHFHRAAIGVNAGVLVGLSPVVGGDRRSGTFNQTLTLTNEQIQAFEAGEVYVNVHSQTHGGGEIRGQMLPVVTRTFVTELAGANERPTPVESPATGQAAVTLTGTAISVTGSFAGLKQAYTNSHLHLAPPTESGGVIVPLQVALDAGDLGGAWHADVNTDTLADAHAKALVEGNVYVNVHSQAHGAGEIRGQLEAAQSVGVAEPGTLPERFALRGNYPNPFNPATRIAFDLPAAAQVSVEVYNLLGQRVLTVTPVLLEAGAARWVEVDGAALGSGLYLYRVVLQTGSHVEARHGSMVLLK